uniref:N-alpha-acetyltransferase 40 n=1 Tax=Culicoides sonorensis TaxID=179676 RepID=A0A336LVB1_CULSO
MSHIKYDDVSVQQRNIEKAQRSPNPLKEVPESQSFAEFSHNGLNFALQCKLKSDLDPKVVKWAFKLAERNVGNYFKTCKEGWQPKIKQNDLNKNWARYLIAVDKSTKKNVAYTMFRFDLDYGSSVLYCYEMQVESEYQRKGLGAFMMKALEHIVQHFKMEKLVLTVLKNNPDAVKFYHRLGYKKDETSPDDEDYEILSKVFIETSNQSANVLEALS